MVWYGCVYYRAIINPVFCIYHYPIVHAHPQRLSHAASANAINFLGANMGFSLVFVIVRLEIVSKRLSTVDHFYPFNHNTTNFLTAHIRFTKMTEVIKSEHLSPKFRWPRSLIILGVGAHQYKEFLRNHFYLTMKYFHPDLSPSEGDSAQGGGVTKWLMKITLSDTRSQPNWSPIGDFGVAYSTVLYTIIKTPNGGICISFRDLQNLCQGTLQLAALCGS